MKIRSLEVSDTRREIICNGYLISEIENFSQLLSAHKDYAVRFPENSILVSLDNLAQAQYTSMHATMFHDLDDIRGHDLSTVDPIAFDKGQHIGYLSTTSEFFILENNFKAKSKNITFSDTCSRGLMLNDDELNLLESVHANPMSLLDANIVMWIVPVSSPSLALCAFPNGYFDSDLNPFENYALSVYLNENYGYSLFGVGASCLGFRRDNALSKELADSLGRDIARLYNFDQNDLRSKRISNFSENHDYLFLKYVEDFRL